MGLSKRGVPPFGHSTQLRVFVDPDLSQYDEVWTAAVTWKDNLVLREVKPCSSWAAWFATRDAICAVVFAGGFQEAQSLRGTAGRSRSRRVCISRRCLA